MHATEIGTQKKQQFDMSWACYIEQKHQTCKKRDLPPADDHVSANMFFLHKWRWFFYRVIHLSYFGCHYRAQHIYIPGTVWGPLQNIQHNCCCCHTNKFSKQFIHGMTSQVCSQQNCETTADSNRRRANTLTWRPSSQVSLHRRNFACVRDLTHAQARTKKKSGLGAPTAWQPREACLQEHKSREYSYQARRDINRKVLASRNVLRGSCLDNREQQNKLTTNANKERARESERASWLTCFARGQKNPSILSNFLYKSTGSRKGVQETRVFFGHSSTVRRTLTYYMIWYDKFRQDRTRQDKTSQAKTRLDKIKK